MISLRCELVLGQSQVTRVTSLLLAFVVKPTHP